jgi:hypothetical protein
MQTIASASDPAQTTKEKAWSTPSFFNSVYRSLIGRLPRLFTQRNDVAVKNSNHFQPKK